MWRVGYFTDAKVIQNQDRRGEPAQPADIHVLERNETGHAMWLRGDDRRATDRQSCDPRLDIGLGLLQAAGYLGIGGGFLLLMRLLLAILRDRAV